MTMENKELIVVGSGFLLIVSIALFLFIGQQKQSNAVKQNKALEVVIEQNQAVLQAQIDSLTVRMDEADAKYHDVQ